MRSLKDYIAEAEIIVESPQAGDDFDLDLAADCLIETYVADADGDSITVYVDEAAYATLEQSGYLGETIRTYGPVGAGPGTGYAHTAARESTESCEECGYPMETCCCEEEIEEGHMKDLDIELQDYESMTPQQFKAAYGMHKAEWALKHMDLFKGKQIDFSGTSGFDFVKEASRMLELAGVSDHKFDQEDDQYCEDQSAGVLAQKELATDITNPMPGVHEDEEIEEGAMKQIMHKAAETMSLEDFVAKFGDKDWVREFWHNINDPIDEAEYHGKHVTLNKPTRGDVKKFKVYVKDPKTGNIKKVNFGHGGTSAKRAGQKTMRIKKSNPARRRSFRARHHCENPGPKTKARYWSCRAW